MGAVLSGWRWDGLLGFDIAGSGIVYGFDKLREMK
jgi:hypothetical protein